MKPTLIDVSELKLSKHNPRIIDTHKFEALKKSLIDFPQMLEIRPILVDHNMTIIAGHMRYRACLEIGRDKVFILKADDLTEQQANELMIKDNISYGEWDEQDLQVNWNMNLFNEWTGVQSIDYSILDYEDLSGDLDDFQSNVKKSLHIPINANFEEAKELETYFRERKVYIGGLLIDQLRKIKDQADENC